MGVSGDGVHQFVDRNVDEDHQILSTVDFRAALGCAVPAPSPSGPRGAERAVSLVAQRAGDTELVEIQLDVSAAARGAVATQAC